MSKARVIFSTGSLFICDTAACFQVAAEAGCDGLEIMCDERWSTRSPDYLNKLSEQFGIRPITLHTPMVHLVRHLQGWDVPRTYVDVAKCTLDLAESIGAETIVVHLPPKVSVVSLQNADTRWQGMYFPWFSNKNAKKMMEWIDKTVPSLETGVKVGVENLPVQRWIGLKANPFYCNTVQEWSTVAPHLTMDTTHWATHGIDPLDAYRAAKKRVAHVHLSNFDGREHRLPHKGDVDLGKLLREMARDGFGGTICIELHPDSLGFPDEKAILQNLKDSVDFCRENLNVS